MTQTQASDELTAALDEIRANHEAANAFGAVAGDPVPRLLAALDEVLKLADQLPPQGPPSSALEEDRMWVRQECADMIREAISRALSGGAA